jgi:hypothetical protein
MAHALSKLFWHGRQKAVADRRNLPYSAKSHEEAVLPHIISEGITMISASTLTIKWSKPNLLEEEWEFFRHPDKQEFYRRHNLDWECLLSVFEKGLLEPYPRSNMLNGIPVSLSYSSYDDYSRYLAKAKRGYRRNYSKMEEELQRTGTLNLRAPIILLSNDEGLLFSGYRRLCLSWNYGIVPCVWVVNPG